MTGYGRGEAGVGGLKLSVELNSVNRKQGEIVVALPRELDSLESRVRDEINQHVARGRLSARIVLHSGADKLTGRVKLNTEAARQFTREARRLAKELKLAGDLTLDALLRLPGVVEVDGSTQDPEALWKPLQKALRQALKELMTMRETEGAHLAADLKSRIQAIEKSVASIQLRAPKVAEQYRENLRQRIANAGLELPEIEDERLIKEVVYFADRSDISEELTRLQSHFQQFRLCARAKEPVGRKLDFLVQEINREINTIGSKANDAAIAAEVVSAKTELERFREQAQNVE